MRCNSCGFESPRGMKFCGQCGSALGEPCHACGAENPPTFRFCGSCGSPLRLPSAPARPGADPAGVLSDRTAERRQLTMMFCDLVGSTSLSYQLDPEELREVVRSYQAACTRIIEAFDGYVAQYLGDGILAYFGYPVALDREASRAVRAGLGILREVGELNERLARTHGIGLGVRIGLHTGLVVVGEVGAGQRREHLAMGDAPNVAARIQGFAAPNTLVMSGETHRLVGNEFQISDLGTRSIRGIPAPVRLYLVLDETAPAGSEAAYSPSEEALIGREAELATLREHWERVTRGQGQVVLISGDPGIGKTALIRNFIHGLELAGCSVVQARCLPYYRNTAYQPFVEILHRQLECEPPEETQGRLLRLSGLVRDDPHASSVMPLLASLLGLPGGEEDPDALTPQRKMERVRSALVGILLRASRTRPLLLCVEDVQWADPSSLDLLGRLAEEVAGRPILLLVTHRSDFRAPWSASRHQHPLVLGRLPADHVEQLLTRIVGEKPLPPDVSEQIIARTDGVPLFVEELTKMVLESGLLRERADRFELVGGALPPLSIPATLHDSLEARLDRLASTKELAQVGAVLGREFRFELLRAVAAVDDDVLATSLARLIEAEMLFQHGSPPNAVYCFKHALVQEAAYQSLLRGSRQVYHLRAAQALEALFPAEASAHPELVAQHYSAAGQVEQAIERWIRAGRLTVERSAVREAVLHLNQGLELLLELEPGQRRNRYELALLLALGPALIATHGHGSDEVRDLYLSAHALADEVGSEDQHFEVLAGLFTSLFVRYELDEARELAEELLTEAESRGDRGSEMAARVAIGAALLGRGRLREAVLHLDRGWELYHPAQHFALAHGAGQDFGVVALLYGAFCRFGLGAPELAAEQARRSVALARQLQHPHTLAFALALSCNVFYFLRQPEAVLAGIDELRQIARAEGFHHWLLEVPTLRSWALIELGRPEEGLSNLAESDGEVEEERHSVRALSRLRIRADAYLRAGRPERAVEVLDRLLVSAGEQLPLIWWGAEIFRLLGNSLAELGRAEEAEAQLARAAEAAREAETPIHLLRALLDRLHRSRSVAARSEARLELERLVGAFGSGLDFPELRAARALLGSAEEPPTPSIGVA